MQKRNISIVLSQPAKCTQRHPPVCDPLWPHYFLSSELLYFEVGQVCGNDMRGFGARVIQMKLPAMQHHKPAQLSRTGIYTHTQTNTQNASGTMFILLIPLTSQLILDFLFFFSLNHMNNNSEHNCFELSIDKINRII